MPHPLTAPQQDSELELQARRQRALIDAAFAWQVLLNFADQAPPRARNAVSTLMEAAGRWTNNEGAARVLKAGAARLDLNIGEEHAA